MAGFSQQPCWATLWLPKDGDKEESLHRALMHNLKFRLAGVLEIGAGLVLYPTMLNDPQSYTSVLCASGDTHIDERYALTFKSYGPHLEFWLLPNRIDPDTEQISEQWGGVISIWSKL